MHSTLATPSNTSLLTSPTVECSPKLDGGGRFSTKEAEVYSKHQRELRRTRRYGWRVNLSWLDREDAACNAEQAAKQESEQSDNSMADR